MKSLLNSFVIFLFSTSIIFAQDPIAVNDTAYIMQYGTVSINVLANDSDPNGEAIHIVEVEEDDDDYYEISFAEEKPFKKQIDIAHYSDGLYLIQFINGRGKVVITRKFVKQ